MKLKNLFLTWAYTAMILVAINGISKAEGLWEVLLFVMFIAGFSFVAAANLHKYINKEEQ